MRSIHFLDQIFPLFDNGMDFFYHTYLLYIHSNSYGLDIANQIQSHIFISL